MDNKERRQKNDQMNTSPQKDDTQQRTASVDQVREAVSKGLETYTEALVSLGND